MHFTNMFKEYANNFSVVKMHLIVQFAIVITGNIQNMKPVQKFTHTITYYLTVFEVKI